MSERLHLTHAEAVHFGKETVVSKILWKNSLRPSLSETPRERVYDVYETYDFRIPQTCAFAWTDEEIVQLPDPRSFNVLSRAGLLLSAAGLGSRDALAPFLKADPFSVGLYCAMQDGPEDYNTAKHMAYAAPEDFARMYKQLRSPKQFLREIGSIGPAMLGIFLGIMGPMYNFTHSRWAALHALEQAEADLQSGVVKAALVGSAFSLDDPLLTMRIHRSIPEGSTLSEGAAVLLLTAAGQSTDWRRIIPQCDDRFYGTAHDLVVVVSAGDEETAKPERAADYVLADS